MTRTTRWASALLLLAALMATACATADELKKIKLPPITVAFPDKPTPPVVSPPVMEPTPEPTPTEPPVVVDARPLVNLNIVVHDATGVGIPGALCWVGDDGRFADGGGFINFAVKGSSVVDCEAKGFVTRTADLPPGDHRFPLASIARPTPPPAPAPPPVTAPPAAAVLEACGERQNDNRVSDGCLMAVASTSKDYELCNRGNAVACHRYVREVAKALRTSTGDPGWGLITKFQGQGCTLTACSQSLIAGEQKYGEDMVAYLPKGNPTNLWTGIDVIVGAGAPGAHYGGGELPPAVGGRPDNLWAPVP